MHTTKAPMMVQYHRILQLSSMINTGSYDQLRRAIQNLGFALDETTKKGNYRYGILNHLTCNVSLIYGREKREYCILSSVWLCIILISKWCFQLKNFSQNVATTLRGKTKQAEDPVKTSQLLYKNLRCSRENEIQKKTLIRREAQNQNEFICKSIWYLDPS